MNHPFNFRFLSTNNLCLLEAEAALLKAIELDPCFVKAQLYLSWHYGKNQGDLVKAREYAEKVLNCSPSKEEEKEAKNYVEFCNKQLKK